MPLGYANRIKAKKRFANLHPFWKETFQIAMVIIGAFLVAFGLEFFLVPNGFLDGGITGISIMLSTSLNLPLGLFIAVLNLPFIALAWKFSGIRNAGRTALGIAALAGATLLFHHKEPLTHEFVLALGYGGVLLGVGVGLALRYGGALDGIESLAHILSHKTNLDVGKIILGANFFIFIVAAFVYTPERAMASFLLFYIVVAPMIKRIVDAGSDVRVVQIISNKHSEVSDAIHVKMHRKVIFTDAHRDRLDDDLKIVTTFISQSEETQLTDVIDEVDPDAIIIFNEASTVNMNSK